MLSVPLFHLRPQLLCDLGAQKNGTLPIPSGWEQHGNAVGAGDPVPFRGTERRLQPCGVIQMSVYPAVELSDHPSQADLPDAAASFYQDVVLFRPRVHFVLKMQ